MAEPFESREAAVQAIQEIVDIWHQKDNPANQDWFSAFETMIEAVVYLDLVKP